MVTGGSGRIGRRLCDRLLDNGYNVSSPEGWELQLDDAHKVRKWVARVRPAWVVHLAAMTNVDKCEREPSIAFYVNVAMTAVLARLCKELKLPMMLASTSFVFEGTENRPLKENDRTNPIQIYGGTKYQAELMLLNLLRQCWIVRLQSIYCIGGNTFLDHIIENIQKGQAIKAVTDQIVCPTRAADAAEAMFALIRDKARPGIYHVSSRDSCRWYDFAMEYARQSMSDATKIQKATRIELSRTALRPKYMAFNCSKIQKLTAWVAPAWKEALAKELNLPYIEERAVGLTG